MVALCFTDSHSSFLRDNPDLCRFIRRTCTQLSQRKKALNAVHLPQSNTGNDATAGNILPAVSNTLFDQKSVGPSSHASSWIRPLSKELQASSGIFSIQSTKEVFGLSESLLQQKLMTRTSSFSTMTLDQKKLDGNGDDKKDDASIGSIDIEAIDLPGSAGSDGLWRDFSWALRPIDSAIFP